MTVTRTPRLALLLLLPPLFVAACAARNGDGVAQACRESGGKWVAESNECEIDDKGWCAARGGTFNACASLCRNAKQPVAACPMMCVPVCALPTR